MHHNTHANYATEKEVVILAKQGRTRKLKHDIHSKNEQTVTIR